MHRSHDYRYLIARWRIVCRAAGLRLRKFAIADELPLYYVETPALRRQPGLYISAGIHGDEPAGPEGLVTWAESRAAELREIPLLIFPCLNPSGLVGNVRLDAEARDLNRLFHDDSIALIRGWKAVMTDRHFPIALALHEDYDGQGLYLYEVQRTRPSFGERLLTAASSVISAEPRPRVDTYKAVAGIIRRPLRMSRFKTFGYPEAVWLHLHHANRTFTVETPSEFALEVRAAAHRAVIDEALRLVLSS